MINGWMGHSQGNNLVLSDLLCIRCIYGGYCCSCYFSLFSPSLTISVDRDKTDTVFVYQNKRLAYLMVKIRERAEIYRHSHGLRF